MAQGTNKDVHGISRVFHSIDDLTSRAGASALVLAVVVVVVLLIFVLGVTSELEYAFTAVASGITLVMVFVIQHTQARQQLAVQMKLDELLRALPQADDHFVRIEVGSEDELLALEERTDAHRAAVRQEDADREPGSGPAASPVRG
jgi:low affinity Fe/Cu permease